MSDYVFNRRDFLKIAGIGAAGAAAGCSKPSEKLIPYLVAPKDTLPGIAYWYASTCQECPAGCGIHVKVREGRAIKVEGNKEHPLNQGGLCARGQASLQALYDPDRVRAPMLKENGNWKPITWDEAMALAGPRLAEAANGGGVTLMTDNTTGSLQSLSAEWASAMGGKHVVYEPFGYESVREANRRTFGQATIPNYDFAKAHMLLVFGADFLETWIAPVDFARGFAESRKHEDSHVVVVEPRLSHTGVNADEWVAVRPGGEMALALAMANVILSEGLGPAVSGRAQLANAVSAWTPEAAAQQTDVSAEMITHMARHFAKAAPSLAISGGVAAQTDQALALNAAVNLLNYVTGNVGQTVKFDRTRNWDAVASFADVQQLINDMNGGSVDAIVVHKANPAYAVPASAGFADAMAKVPFKLGIAHSMDETMELCDLVLPASHSIESLGDSQPARGIYTMVQPAMQKLPMVTSQPAGDVLLGLARGAGKAGGFPATWTDYVKSQWRRLYSRHGAGRDFDTFWNETLQKGGIYEDVSDQTIRWVGTPRFEAPSMNGSGDMTLVVYPVGALHDGRGANKAWLQELPDNTTKAVWGSWVEMHPETADKLGVKQGDAVKITTDAGSVEVPAYLYSGVRKDVVAIPLGQGHTGYGRYATGRGVNALSLLQTNVDAESGALAYLGAKASAAKGAEKVDLSLTQTEKSQHGRRIAQIIPLSAIGHGDSHVGHGAVHHPVHPSQTRPGKHTEPRIDGDIDVPAHAITAYEPEFKARAARQIPVSEGSYKNAKHRWALAIDVDRCTGCSACMVGCAAENNIPMVGPEMVKRGRDMHWIRIERFEERVEPGKLMVLNQPMMCQHCGDAPCEIVCPVYATYHNPEGLNAQIYNRCVGTRYCSNNCPYKVRMFNWFDYAAPEKSTFAFPEPLNWQLNPDVTVRSKGVMEKCTMCIQRIHEGKGVARDEERPLRDGEFTTACAQSCPTEAIVFGDLADPNSKVSKLSRESERRYWVFNELNTKPGVTYLKKIDRMPGHGDDSHGDDHGDGHGEAAHEEHAETH